MVKDTANNIRLGIFISSGLVILILSLYLIGKNQNFFGSNFYVRARFSNINGLISGNNVRYSGIQAGTVDKITVIDDTTIEVTLLISKKMKPFIHQNTFAAIGNDGLMGNKVINLTPNPAPAPEVTDNGLLYTKKQIATEDMMQTLSKTNDNVEVISEGLKNTVTRLNSSAALWGVLEDSALPGNVTSSLANLREAATKINTLSASLNAVVNDARNGKGIAGMLLADEKTAANMKHAIENLDRATNETNSIITQIDSLTRQVQYDVAQGRGTVHAMLKDTALVSKLQKSMDNIERGTENFSQDMEALKHNFLTRGYFRREAKKNKKATRQQ